MDDSPLLHAVLLSSLALIMFGLGLSLTTADFTRITRQPRVALVALGCQILVLPALCFALVTVLDLAAPLAVGMMLLAASPGGTVANLYSHLAGGDVALNITLTAVNSVLAPFTMPIVVNLAMAHFIGSGEDIGLGFGELAQVFAVVLVPVALGMLVRRRYREFADRMDRPGRIVSGVFLLLVVLGAIFQEREHLLDYVASVGLATALFGLLSFTVGYGAPRLARAGRRQAIASAMEISVHNTALAITIAISPDLLGNTEMASPAAIYTVVAFTGAMIFTRLMRRAGRSATPVGG
ncbi:BASS family bile acid:Na+ symporter [Thermocatellispora tengchongensis]|uniref:BASS family bile acid:Na+ symporter n=1 Tax=Thermocatellispora tengchongensis TaxID=1073253 RepID=A0A840PKR2_9ACTN|nr:bile acid:sodium symporter family protein [Thermocatellispora tengchongensis]MBB5140108.1 BASS family bile acid:Na+ symporter [Thermocatellispora tengchongensis]